MRRLNILTALAIASVGLAGCDLVGDVLEFGFWTIVILIALVVLLLWGLRASLRGRGRRPPPPPPA